MADSVSLGAGGRRMGRPKLVEKVRPILNPIADGDEVRVSDDV